MLRTKYSTSWIWSEEILKSLILSMLAFCGGLVAELEFRLTTFDLAWNNGISDEGISLGLWLCLCTLVHWYIDPDHIWNLEEGCVNFEKASRGKIVYLINCSEEGCAHYWAVGPHVVPQVICDPVVWVSLCWWLIERVKFTMCIPSMGSKYQRKIDRYSQFWRWIISCLMSSHISRNELTRTRAPLQCNLATSLPTEHE